MRPCSIAFTGILIAILLTVFACQSSAQGDSRNSSQQESNPRDDEIAELQQDIADVDSNTELSDEEKVNLKQSFQDTIQSLKDQWKWQDSVAEDEALINSVEERLRNTQDEFEKTSSEPEEGFASNLEIAEVEKQLLELRPKLEAEQKRVTDLEQERINRTSSRKDIPQQLNDLATDIGIVNTELAKSPTEPESAEVTAARKAELTTKLQALEAESKALQTKLRRYDAENELLPVQTDLARRKALLLAEQVKLLGDRQVELRQTEAEKQVTQAKRFEEQFSTSPSLVSISQAVQSMATQRIALTGALRNTATELTQSQERLKRLQEEFKRTKNRVDNIGTVSSLGSLLRKQQATLPDGPAIRQRVADRQNLIRETELSLYDAADARNRFSDPDKRARSLSESTGISQDRIIPLLTLQRKVAGDLERELDEYFDRLVDLNTTSQQTLQEIDAFADYINENILWIRSNRPLWEITASEFSESAKAAFDIASWQRVWTDIWTAIRSNLSIAIGVVVLFLLLYWERRRMRRQIEKAGELVQPVTSTKFKPTIMTILLTIGVSALWPLVLFFLGWLATQSKSSQTVAVGQALTTTGWCYFALEFIRQTCRRNGLAINHFRWPERVVSLVRNNVRLAMLIIIPLSFLQFYLQSLDDEEILESLERIVFMLLQIAQGYFIFQIFRPGTGVFKEYLEDHPEGWADRTRFLWFGTLLVVPLTLLVLASLGYLYTAQQLYDRLQLSFLIILILMVVSGLLTRWVLVSRRRLRLQQLRSRLSQSGIDLTGLPVDTASDVDLRTINVQSKRLIRSALVIVGVIGLYIVWSGVLPALQALDETVLWSVAQGEGKEPMAITPKHILFLFPIVVATWIAARNAPGLLEIAVLQRLPLDSSVRYAITTLVSYIIVVIGVLIFCSTIGVNWSSVQFIVAAVGVGLGFGLQEIFANFVSGLILLFERPIRVGDIVTIDDVTGVVTRIHIRATTITDWDRKEFIVPNKDFVTGRLKNWTLSDTTNRITINVGVSYSSNPEYVTRLLTETLEQHPAVLDDPQSVVTFESFGDNSLLFVVRTYIATLNNRLKTIHELHTQIFNRFRDEGVEISFPQLDLHVRSVPSTAIEAMHNGQDQPSSTVASAEEHSQT